MSGRRRIATQDDMDEVLGLLEDGLSMSAVARELGWDRHTISRWSREAGYTPSFGNKGGVRLVVQDRPAEVVSDVHTPGHGRRLDAFDRAHIQSRHEEGMSGAAIARYIGCSASTVTRELKRNTGTNGHYHARAAQRDTDRRRRRGRQCFLDSRPELRQAVIGYLRDWFSPQQVAAQLRKDFPDREEMWVSHETIYQALYMQGRGTLRQELAKEKALRSGRTSRVPQSRLPKARGQTWVQGCHISTRPPEVADRAVPGHWEGDLVVGTKNQSAIITLVERTSRLVILRRLPGKHDTTSVMPLLAEMIGSLPEVIRKTLTWDQGPEMASHPELTLATNIQVFFCDPHSPWQRGSNENTNGLLRDFFSKGTDFRKVTDEQVAEAERLLNKRPRQTLGWRTPAEVFQQVLADSALTA